MKIQIEMDEIVAKHLMINLIEVAGMIKQLGTIAEASKLHVLKNALQDLILYNSRSGEGDVKIYKLT